MTEGQQKKKKKMMCTYVTIILLNYFPFPYFISNSNLLQKDYIETMQTLQTVTTLQFKFMDIWKCVF